MDFKELKVQVALGTLPEEFRIPGVKRHRQCEAINNRKTCKFCQRKIKKGTKYYDIGTSYASSLNICNDCSYLSIVQVLKHMHQKEKDKPNTGE